jgi:hypothetical protein
MRHLTEKHYAWIFWVFMSLVVVAIGGLQLLPLWLLAGIVYLLMFLFTEEEEED